MNVSIKTIRPATNEEWDEIWKNCDYATYFHSREWSEIWNRYSNGNIRPSPKLIIFSDKKRALLPISFQKSFKGLIKQYISSPAGTFGGWISLDSLEFVHGQHLVQYLTKYNNLVWRINPYDKNIFKLKIKSKKDDETHVINLKNTFDNIYKSWTKGHRSAVHKAQKNGVLIKIVSLREEWHKYYELYEDSILRWGSKASSHYRRDLFEEFYFRKSPYIKLWLALYMDRIIAGALCFYGKNHVVYWHGAALDEYFNLRPVNYLIYEAIKDACEKGYVWFDFNPSGGHSGSKAFKKSFGTEVLPCPVVRLEVIWVRVVRKMLATIRKKKL